LIEPVILRVPPHTKLDTTMNHAGEEYMFVLSGAIDFLYGRDVHHLDQHESVYFKSDVPHYTFNDGDEEATVFAVMTSRQNIYNGKLFYRFLQDGSSNESKS
jgi:mannose-6-phosphate isomerase-like protein (cupin superfamily)